MNQETRQQAIFDRLSAVVVLAKKLDPDDSLCDQFREELARAIATLKDIMGVDTYGDAFPAPDEEERSNWKGVGIVGYYE